ncbi:MAG: tRNA (adenosine(37)-N6)-threonylcarbamoyltransferase complex ATPase subunit type 1 TsaE [Candidatus Bipolaricaulota bacterium]|nr:tRNA (adenosine(37)-N6)-threonylcarbamoyltransferase complex ATPase subunit type 1 TsaE [Candidatus Bipolaricaulota bacterium]
MQEFTTGSPEETKGIGKKLVRKYGPNRVFCLFGPLAAGKTTLVKGLAEELGVKKTIVSPSYVLLREYEGESTLYHLDLFRIQSGEEFVEAGLDEYLLEPEGIVAIEWADRIEDILPENRVDVELELVDEGKRIIRSLLVT